MILNSRQVGEGDTLVPHSLPSNLMGQPGRVQCLVYRDDILHHKFKGPESDLQIHMISLSNEDPGAEWYYDIVKREN